MNNLIKTLSEVVGLPTIISAVIVCLIMLFVKKIKPKMSPKTELILRLIVSILVRVVFVLVLKGDFGNLAESSLSACGVSLIICAFFSKSDNVSEIKEMVSVFLPNVSQDKIDKIFSSRPDSQEEISDESIKETEGTMTAMQSQTKPNDNRHVSG